MTQRRGSNHAGDKESDSANNPEGKGTSTGSNGGRNIGDKEDDQHKGSSQAGSIGNLWHGLNGILFRRQRAVFISRLYHLWRFRLFLRGCPCGQLCYHHVFPSLLLRHSTLKQNVMRSLL